MFRIDFGLICWLLFVFAMFKQGICLKDIQIKVPEAVAVGDDVTLSCSCNTEDEKMYAIKWYLKNEEFYRYVPSEMPQKKIFHDGDITVDIEKSTQNNVVLKSVSLKSSGNYKCEILGDGPKFNSVAETGQLLVVQVPQSGPILKINNIKINNNTNIVSFGKKLNATCVSSLSEPNVNFIWTINGFQYLSPHTESNKSEIWSEIPLHVTLKPSLQNKMIVRCETNILNFYRASEQAEFFITRDTIAKNSSEE